MANTKNANANVNYIKINKIKMNELNNILMEIPYKFSAPIVNLINSCIDDNANEINENAKKDNKLVSK